MFVFISTYSAGIPGGGFNLFFVAEVSGNFVASLDAGTSESQTPWWLH